VLHLDVYPFIQAETDEIERFFDSARGDILGHLRVSRM
jgi:hypothetical protein